MAAFGQKKKSTKEYRLLRGHKEGGDEAPRQHCTATWAANPCGRGVALAAYWVLRYLFNDVLKF